MFRNGELSSPERFESVNIGESEKSGERKIFLENFYSHQKITAERSRKLVDELCLAKTHPKGFRGFYRYDSRYGFEEGQSKSFYATSSDAMEVLRKVDVRDRRVTTVAGSSDFWQIFANGGAEEINVFDFSLPAIFYAELKLAGLENLNFKEYIRMFGRSTDDLLSRGTNFFDWDIYKKIRDKLSSQAVAYFDGLLRQKDVLFTYKGRNDDEFVHFREESPFIGGMVKTDRDYEALKSRSKKIQYRFFLKNINGDPKSEEIASSDTVYLSNIGYGFQESLKLAAEIISGGAKKVVTSISENGLRRYPSPLSKKEITEGVNLGTFNGVQVTVLGIGKQREVGQIILEMVGD